MLWQSKLIWYAVVVHRSWHWINMQVWNHSVYVHRDSCSRWVWCTLSSKNTPITAPIICLPKLFAPSPTKMWGYVVIAPGWGFVNFLHVFQILSVWVVHIYMYFIYNVHVETFTDFTWWLGKLVISYHILYGKGLLEIIILQDIEWVT